MDRLIRLNQIWSWLPAFRAVAETEHVHEAAARLHLTPSTLSRAIRLLEDDLGQALFLRVGRSLALTDAGHELLRALREAMRLVDDALVTVTRQPTAPLRVAAEEALALAVVLDALDPTGGPELVAAGGDLAAQLLSGSIDVAFATEARASDELEVERLGDLMYSAFSASGATQPFIDAPDLPWPPERPRALGVRVASASLALAACRAGAGVAVLPDVMAGELVLVRDGEGEALVRLWRPVYAVRRRALGATASATAAGALVAAVRARLAQPVRELAMDGFAARA